MLFATVLMLLALASSWAAPGNVQWMEISPAQEMKPVHKVHPAYKGVVVDYSPYEDSWNNYKQIFNKKYEGAHEETYRFDVFIKNVMKIEYHNSKLYNNGLRSYYMGVNQFTDMDNMEFRKYNGFLRSRSSNATEECSSFLAAENIQLPTSVDWRNKGIVTEVKNQGQCGSCWSFSTTGSLEGQHAKKSGKLADLSEQQLVDCSGKYGNHGCEGGLMDQAFLYIRDIGGLESETEYPYDAREETCEFQKSEVVATCTGCVDVTSEDEDALKKALGTVGPISVAIDASHPTFQSYKGGVYDEPECSSTELDHGVLAVGYGVKGGQDYWLVKNSWGTIWGDEGYIYMSRNKNNQCGIATTASYPLV